MSSKNAVHVGAILFGIVISLLPALALAPTAAADDPLHAGPPFLISSAALVDENPAVAYNSNQHLFLVVWEKNGVIYSRPVSELGAPLAAEKIIGSAISGSPDVAYNSFDDQFLVVFDHLVAAPIIDFDIVGVRLSGDGQNILAGFSVVSQSGYETRPAVAFNTHVTYRDFMVVYAHSTSIYAQRVAGTSGTGNWGPNKELVNVQFYVAQSVSPKTYDQPDVAYNLNRNEYLAVYTLDTTGGLGPLDVVGRRITGNGQRLAERAIDSSPGDQYTPAVAAYRLNKTTPYLVVFTDEWNDPAGDVRGYLVNGDGQPVSLLNIATLPGGDERFPDVAGSEALGGYTVVWQQFTADWDVFGRRISHSGTMESAFNISKVVPVVLGLDETEPAVAGGAPVALAAWQDDGWGTSSWDIAGRILGYRTRMPVILRNQ
jgi:hypothetical protein